ncbi:hypothetical protein HMI54_014609, partial [Coelomomyces lativittatus]
MALHKKQVFVFVLLVLCFYSLNTTYANNAPPNVLQFKFNDQSFELVKNFNDEINESIQL